MIDWIEFYAVSAIFQPCNGDVRHTAYMQVMMVYVATREADDEEVKLVPFVTKLSSNFAVNVSVQQKIF